MRPRLASGAAAVLVALVAGCGSSHDEHAASTSGRPTRGNATDAAFVRDMVPHHETAVQMAELAATRAEHPELRKLAASIVTSQRREIATMKSVEASLPQGHVGHMSGDEHVRGMDMDPMDLRDARPFDRAFLAMMVPHHQGAVTMAREELAKGRDPTLRKLATSIIATQQREMAQMRDWQRQWYEASAGSEHSKHRSGDASRRSSRNGSGRSSMDRSTGGMRGSDDSMGGGEHSTYGAQGSKP